MLERIVHLGNFVPFGEAACLVKLVDFGRVDHLDTRDKSTLLVEPADVIS
jgi:hypothetical protein